MAMRLASGLLLMLAACQGDKTAQMSNADSETFCRMLPDKSETLGRSKAGIQYFPRSFGKVMHVCNFKGYPECFPKVSQFENEWYSKHWDAAQEPSVYEMSKDRETENSTVLRFTWLPTFHHPVIVRFEMSPESSTMSAKELSGAGGYEPGSISREINRKLNSSETRQLKDAMAKASPFNEPPVNCELGLDGSQWMLESADKGNYHFAQRWSPEDGAMRDFGILALKLTGWKFEEIY
jgi:hypothetical protein